MIYLMIHMMIYRIYNLWSFPFQATVRLHSCCMMTCTLNGGPEVGADREGLEARRMPGRQQHQQQMGNQHQQKFPGNKTTNSKARSPVRPCWTITMCALMPVTSYWMFLVRWVCNRQSPKSDAKMQKWQKQQQQQQNAELIYPVEKKSGRGLPPAWECLYVVRSLAGMLRRAWKSVLQVAHASLF